MVTMLNKLMKRRKKFTYKTKKLYPSKIKLSDCRKNSNIKIGIVNFCDIAKPSLEGRWHSDLSLCRKGGGKE